jgi:hypothetical protein
MGCAFIGGIHLARLRGIASSEIQRGTRLSDLGVHSRLLDKKTFTLSERMSLPLQGPVDIRAGTPTSLWHDGF